MPGRHLFLETGFHAQLDGKKAHEKGENSKPDQERSSIPEAKPFQALKRALKQLVSATGSKSF